MRAIELESLGVGQEHGNLSPVFGGVPDLLDLITGAFHGDPGLMSKVLLARGNVITVDVLGNMIQVKEKNASLYPNGH